MAVEPNSELGRRERQIMDVVYRRGRATAAEVLADLPDPPSYSSVRAMLRYLEDKGRLRHERDGPRYAYLPTAPRDEVRSSALQHVVRTFFEGSVASAVAALLGAETLSADEHRRLARLIDDAAPKPETDR
jgi:BlaI family transcriptional regulator, penicillinase repressor